MADIDPALLQAFIRILISSISSILNKYQSTKDTSIFNKVSNRYRYLHINIKEMLIILNYQLNSQLL